MRMRQTRLRPSRAHGGQQRSDGDKSLQPTYSEQSRLRAFCLCTQPATLRAFYCCSIASASGFRPNAALREYVYCGARNLQTGVCVRVCACVCVLSASQPHWWQLCVVVMRVTAFRPKEQPLWYKAGRGTSLRRACSDFGAVVLYACYDTAGQEAWFHFAPRLLFRSMLCVSRTCGTCESRFCAVFRSSFS